MSVNKVILVGNVGKDPEIRHLDTGIAVANFSLATSETYLAKNGEKVTTTEWHNIVLWRGLAEVAEKYVTKGRQLYIEGRIRTRNYDDKDGIKRYITEIYGDTMQLLGTKADDNKSVGGQYNQNQNNTGLTPPASMAKESEMDEPGGDEDLPF